MYVVLNPPVIYTVNTAVFLQASAELLVVKVPLERQMKYVSFYHLT